MRTMAFHSMSASVYSVSVLVDVLKTAARIITRPLQPHTCNQIHQAID
jgi:hypothetical protein